MPGTFLFEGSGYSQASEGRVVPNLRKRSFVIPKV